MGPPTWAAAQLAVPHSDGSLTAIDLLVQKLEEREILHKFK